MVNKLREQEIGNLPILERIYYEKINGKLCRVTLHISSSFIYAFFQNTVGGIYTTPNLDELHFVSFYEKPVFEFVLSFNKVMKIVGKRGITQLPLHPRYWPQKPKPKPRLIKIGSTM